MTAETAPGVISDEARRLHVVGPEEPPLHINVHDTRRGFDNYPAEIPLRFINKLPQIRAEYTKQELQDLALSMIATDKNGERYIHIGHEPWIAVLDETQATEYLADTSLYYKEGLKDKHLQLENYEVSPDGLWRFVIAGHRRTLALEIACAMLGASSNDYMFKYDAYEGISFDDANILQGIENEHARPPARDEAEDINRFFEYYEAKHGQQLTIQEIAEKKRMGQTKVSNALRYARLPIEIKEAEKKGLFSYTVAVNLGELQSLYRRKGLRKLKARARARITAEKSGNSVEYTPDLHFEFESADEYAKYEVLTAFARLNGIETERISQKRSLSNTERIKIIEAYKGLLRTDLMYDDELFVIEAERPSVRRALAIRQLANSAITGFELIFNVGNPEQVAEAEDRLLEILRERLEIDVIGASRPVQESFDV